MDQLLGMLDVHRRVRAKFDIWDINQDEPIPKGTVVEVQDQQEGMYFVQWRGKIYAADHSELVFE